MEKALSKGTTLQKGKYVIVKALGQGSFGITYLAFTKLTMIGELGQMDAIVNVAVKEFFMSEMNSRSKDGSSIEGSNGSLFSNYRQKFKKEAENLSKLDHPNIVNVLDVFDENNTTYYVMQYIDGQSLDDYILQHNGIRENKAISIIKEIGKAVQYMHSNKILHLDLKPQNVMLDKEEKIHLIDFGLSKQYDSKGEPESSTKVGAGTPGYAPIEQTNYREGKGFPVTMDVYALGATMFKMLTGIRPPEASDILNDGFPLYELQEHKISDILSASVAKAMSPAKKDRYQTVEEFLSSFEEEATIIDIEVADGKSEGEVKNVESGLFEISPLTKKVDLLPMPDGVVKISLKNPEPDTLSFDFFLNDNGRNNVIVYRGRKEILNEYWWGDIGDDVVNALKRNGFFSKVHWERESSTSPLTGITVSCTFFYKNGDAFVREIKHANPSYHHLLLDAIYDVVNVKELSLWINKALERECSYSREDIENYGISIFSFMPNYEMPIYYRGHIYSGNGIGIYGIKNYSQLTATFDYIKYNLQKSDVQQLDFDSYLRNHKEEIDKSFNIITYCGESDLLKILYKLRQNPSAFGRYRIVQEVQLLPLCRDCFEDATIAYEYPYLYCVAECGCGVVEILRAGFSESKDDYTAESSLREMSIFESLTSLILGSIVQYHILEEDWEDCVLLSMMPFAIKAEEWINGQCRDVFTLIERNTTIPCMESETIRDGDCSIVISFLGKRFSINVKELFRYKPKSLELTVDIDANTRIRFVFRDKEMEKEISISQTEIFSYEVKTNNEDTTWPD